ncbi:HD-GYP domain-containing protein, partial [Sulfuricurvum sp.]|uniref:HD-GYP domain-containing protein n=1 Tax=Sulfuricurvum sp. TaxID=2025608 RepID=UPI003BB6E3FB
MKKQYKAIDKRLITEGSTVDFNLFLTNETKTAMTLFIQSDSAVDSNTKVKLREIEMLYISEEEEERYNNYIKQHLQSIVKNNALTIEEKAILIYAKATESIDLMFKNPESLENVKSAQGIVTSFIELILNDTSAVESLMKITAHDYYTHTHSINVSVYTLSLGSFLCIKDKDLETLGMAAILHDLGKSKINYSIINKNGKLTEFEFNQMKNHPSLGYA